MENWNNVMSHGSFSIESFCQVLEVFPKNDLQLETNFYQNLTLSTVDFVW